MEVIQILADTLNKFTFHAFVLFQKFLHFNFTFVSSILKCVEDIKEAFLECALPVLHILHCYYRDLIVFLCEVVDIIKFLIDTAIFILQNTFIKIVYGINNFTDLIYAAYQNIVYFFVFVHSCVLQTYEFIIYFVQLIFNSLLLILQLVPNLLIFLFNLSKICLYYILEALLNFATLLTENAFNISSRCTEIIINIPVKAYVGALLLALLFHQYKIILKYLKAYFALLILLLVEIGNYVMYIAFISLKFATKVSATILKAFKSILFLDGTVSSEESSDRNSERNSHLAKVYRFLQRYSFKLQTFLKKYLIRGKHAEEQIEQLQRELMAEREKHTCIICFDRPRSIILHPCHHMCICEECSSDWYTNLQRCPLCRQTIFDVYSVYT